MNNIYSDQIGFLLRLILVFKGNLKKMRNAKTKNKILENELNTQWGTNFLILSILLFVLLYNLL